MRQFILNLFTLCLISISFSQTTTLKGKITDGNGFALQEHGN